MNYILDEMTLSLSLQLPIVYYHVQFSTKETQESFLLVLCASFSML